MNKRHDEAVELAGIIENKMRDESYIFSDVAAIDAADEILNIGYRKITWHKVTDGDLPEDCQKIRWVDSTREYYNGTYYNDGTKEEFSSDLGCDFYKDEVIAWTELPRL